MNKHQANHHLGFSIIIFSSNWSWLAEAVQPSTITRAKFCQCGQFVEHPIEQSHQSSSRSNRAIYLKWAVPDRAVFCQTKLRYFVSHTTQTKPSPNQTPRDSTSNCTHQLCTQSTQSTVFLLRLDVVEVLAQRKVPNRSVLGQPHQQGGQVWVQAWMERKKVRSESKADWSRLTS